MNKKIITAIFLSLIALLIIHSILTFLNLPKEIAFHFDLNGTPTSLGNKILLLFFDFGLLSIFILLEITVFFLDKINPMYVSLINKDYWLAKEHIGETKEYFTKMFRLFDSFLIVFFIAVKQLLYQANVSKTSLNKSLFILSCLIFSAALIIWSIFLFKKFASKTGTSNTISA